MFADIKILDGTPSCIIDPASVIEVLSKFMTEHGVAIYEVYLWSIVEFFRKPGRFYSVIAR